MNKRETQLLIKMTEIASEALYLASAYSGNDSESVASLEERFNKLELEVASLEQ